MVQLTGRPARSGVMFCATIFGLYAVEYSKPLRDLPGSSGHREFCVIRCVAQVASHYQIIEIPPARESVAGGLPPAVCTARPRASRRCLSRSRSHTALKRSTPRSATGSTYSAGHAPWGTTLRSTRLRSNTARRVGPGRPATLQRRRTSAAARGGASAKELRLAIAPEMDDLAIEHGLPDTRVPGPWRPSRLKVPCSRTAPEGGRRLRRSATMRQVPQRWGDYG